MENVTVKEVKQDQIDKTIALSIQIFRPNSEELSRYHARDVWLEHYSHDGLLVGAFVQERMVGFLFAYVRMPQQKTSHCWILGVHENYRRHGILERMMDQAFNILRQRGFQFFTLNTYPERFPAMYAFLEKHDFDMIGMTGDMTPENDKVYMRKSLETPLYGAEPRRA